jgi:hypothetical protein
VGAVGPLKKLDAPTRNLQNIKDKHGDQPAKKTCDNVGIQALLLMNRSGWKLHTFKNKYHQDVLCNLVEQMLIFLKEGG